MSEFSKEKKTLCDVLNVVAKAGVAEHVSTYALIDTEDPGWPFDFRWIQKEGAATRENTLFNERLFESGFLDFGFREVRNEDNLESVVYKSIEDMFTDKDCIGVAPLEMFEGNERVRMARGIEDENEDENPENYKFALFAKGVEGNIVDGQPAQELDYEDVPKVLGLVFKYTVSIEGKRQDIVAFQRTQPMWILKKSSFLLFNREGGTETFSDRSLKLGTNFDFIIYQGTAYFRTLRTLEGLFGFRRLMQQHARDYAEELDHLVADFEKLEERISESTTVANKLLKLQKDASPVVDMPASELEYRVKRMACYSTKVNFNQEGKVMLVTNGNVNDFLRVLSDDVLVSPLSEARYQCRSKKRLDDPEL